MKKTQIKFFSAALSIAMVASLAPAMASATTEARKIDNKTAYKTAFNYDESITFEEAFPSEWFRDSIKEVLKSERERNQYGDAKGEYDSTKIELEDYTVLDSEIKEQLSMVKSLSLTMKSDTNESNITMKDLESIGKYFTGLEELSLSSINIHGGYDELSEALSTFGELKVMDLAGCVIANDDKLDSAFVVPEMDNLKVLRENFCLIKPLDTSNLNQLKSLYVERSALPVFKNNEGLTELELAPGQEKDLTSLDVSHNVNLEKLTVKNSGLISLNLENNPKLDVNSSDEGRGINLINNYRTAICLDTDVYKVDDPNFDGDKVSNVRNGSFSNGKFILNNPDDELTYDYECAPGKKIEFTIMPFIFKKLEVPVGTKITDDDVDSCFINRGIAKKYAVAQNKRYDSGMADDDYNQAAITNELMPNETEVETDKVGATGEIECYLGYDADGIGSGILLDYKLPYEVVDSSYRESYDSNDGSWRYDNTSGRWCFIINGQGPVSDCLCKINGDIYAFDNSGWMKTGWLYEGGNWYYFNKKNEGIEGAATTNSWRKINGDWYYFYEDGKMASDTMIGSYYVNKLGAWVMGKWVKSGSKYWYELANGGYAKNEFKNINENTYYFDGSGWMKTGWLYKGGSWYYFNKKGEGTEGAMAQSCWKKISGKWYYFYKNGKMASDTTIGSYNVNSSGVWVKGQWVKSGSRYWYKENDGKYPKNCFRTINKNTYYFDGSGWMKTGWLHKGGSWYYFNKKGQGTEGAMVYSGWKKISGKWYYFYKNGKMAADTTIGSSYVNSSGVWVNRKWVKSGNRYWYKLENGKYPKSQFMTINKNTYYFDNNGWMKTGWLIIGDNMYYFNKKGEGTEGAMVKNQLKKIGRGSTYFDEHGIARMGHIGDPGPADTGKWIKSGNKYWFRYKEGGYPKNKFELILNNEYYFDNDGYMKTGWLKKDGVWYYFNKKGEGTEGALVQEQWKKIDGKWYYFYMSGEMAVSTNVYGYYIGNSGAMVTGKWVKSGNRYWYSHEGGLYTKDSYELINGNKYIFDDKGYMKTGWARDIDNYWYYCNKKGQGVEGAVVRDQWKKIDGNWYYFYENGIMASDVIQDVYYLGKSGTIETGWKEFLGKWYYFDEYDESQMAVDEWKEIDGLWYYFDEYGEMATDIDTEYGYIDENGVLVE